MQREDACSEQRKMHATSRRCMQRAEEDACNEQKMHAPSREGLHATSSDRSAWWVGWSAEYVLIFEMDRWRWIWEKRIREPVLGSLIPMTQ